MGVPSESAVKIIKCLVSICASSLSFTVDDATIKFFANQLDAAASLAKEGAHISPAQLSAILATKALGVVSLTRSVEWRCAAAISIFGINTVQFAVSSAGAVATEGALAYGAYVEGYGALSAMYEARNECTSIAKRFEAKAVEGTMMLNYNIERLLLSGHM